MLPSFEARNLRRASRSHAQTGFLKMVILGPFGPPYTRLGPLLGRLGAPLGFQNGDFTWEVLPKWQDGDVKRTC